MPSKYSVKISLAEHLANGTFVDVLHTGNQRSYIAHITSDGTTLEEIFQKLHNAIENDSMKGYNQKLKQLRFLSVEANGREVPIDSRTKGLVSDGDYVHFWATPDWGVICTCEII
jgi:hypothetical protein